MDVSMPRKLTGNKLIIASHNHYKIQEIKSMLENKKIELITAAELNLSEPIEDGETYLDNALIKARVCANACGIPALADDSGIEVLALGNTPGVHTAPYTKNMGGRERVFEMWQKDEKIRINPQACFVCVQVLAWPDGHYESFHVRVSGTLSFPPQGQMGHGYDPIFIPSGHTKTMAEMSFAEKNRCSHRYQAVQGILRTVF